MTQIIDLDGTSRSMAWLAQTYDCCTVLQADTSNATQVWRLTAIYVTEGPATFKAEARRIAGPSAMQPVAFTWPSLEAPSTDLPALPSNPYRWASRAVVQNTNSEGITGFGLGSTYGPFYHAWIVSAAPSDCLTKTGMKGGTNHRGPLHGVWVLQSVQPPQTTLAQGLIAKAEQAQVIQFNPQAALQRRIFADNFVPNSPEFTHEFGGIQYVGQRAEHLQSGEVRVYYARVNFYDDVRFVVRP